MRSPHHTQCEHNLSEQWFPTCFPTLLLLSAVRAVMGRAAKMKMAAPSSPVLATSLIASRPGVAAVQEEVQTAVRRHPNVTWHVAWYSCTSCETHT